HEVAHGDEAALHLDARAVAEVGDHPPRAAHRRRRVLPLRREAALALAPQAPDGRRALRACDRRLPLRLLAGLEAAAGERERGDASLRPADDELARHPVGLAEEDHLLPG